MSEYKIVGHKVGHDQVTWAGSYREATLMALEWRQEGFSVKIYRDGELVV